MNDLIPETYSLKFSIRRPFTSNTCMRTLDGSCMVTVNTLRAKPILKDPCRSNIAMPVFSFELDEGVALELDLAELLLDLAELLLCFVELLLDLAELLLDTLVPLELDFGVTLEEDFAELLLDLAELLLDLAELLDATELLLGFAELLEATELLDLTELELGGGSTHCFAYVAT